MSRRNIIASLSVLLAFGFIIHGCGTKQQDQGVVQDSTAAASAGETKGRDSVTVTLMGKDSVTVFELLQMSHYVESRSTSMGVFVQGIDSMRAGGKANWIYAVNDTVPKIASDKMFTHTGDTIVWRLHIPGE